MLVVADFIQWAKDNGILVGVGRGCLAADTLVLTSRGFKQLKDVKINDIVFTHTGKLKRVENTFQYDVNENLLKIKTDFSFGQICLTEDHKVWAVKAQKTEKYETFLSNGWSYPFKGKKYILQNEPRWIPASKLQKGDYIFMPFPQIRRNVDVEFLNLTPFIGPYDKIIGNTIVTNIPLINEFSIRHIARKTGLSRGTIKRTKTNNKILGSTENNISNHLKKYGIILDEWKNKKNVKKRVINKKIDVNEDFCYVLGRWIGDGWIFDKNQSYGIGIAFNRSDEMGKNRVFSYFKDLGFYCNFISHKNKNLDQLIIHSYSLAGLFRSLFPDYKDKSNTKYVGENWKYLPNNKLKSLLEGVIDSDGHRREKSRDSIDTTSERLVKDLKEIFLYLKVVSSISIRHEYKRGSYLCNKSYKIRFYLDKTSNIVKDRLFENGYYTQIKEISEKYENKVYDIQVKDDKSYLTQNYAVHNSVGGSMVGYLLGIHGVDPIEYGLLFERFQNAYKKDLPDIDTDFTSAGRDLVQEYCRKKYGHDHCAQVSNINTYTPKNVIPDLVKSMRNVMPGLVENGENYVKVSNAIKDAIPEMDKNGKKIKSLEQAMELSSKLREFAQGCPELMKYADAFIGLSKEYSTHAAGMVISDVPIVEFAPLRVDKNNDIAVQYEKNRCESIGLVKMDFLAISTLDIIDETFKNIKRSEINNGPGKVEDIPLNDEETYKMIQNGHTKCVFQLGKSGMFVSLCKLIKPKNIVDIAMVNALGRPSSSNEERKEYANRRFGKKEVIYLHPSLERALKETYGLGIFEEQLMAVAQDVAGWDLNKADGLRKLTKLKGKNPKLALQLEVEFIEGTIKQHGVEYEKAKEIWDKVVLPFAGYGFNKSHAVFYSINGYITAYLKCHYPAAFLAAYLKIKAAKGGISKDEEIAMAKYECRRIGIKIVPPDINKSSGGYEVLDENTIVMGFSAIKGMGDKAIQQIVSKQPFANFVDFLHRVDARVVNKTKLEVLAKAGCFDSMDLTRKAIHDEGKSIRDKMTTFLRKKAKDGYDSEMVIEEFPFKLSDSEWSKSEILRHEQEVLNELVSGDMKDLFPGFFTGANVTPINRLKFLPNRQDIISEFLVKSVLREFKIKKGKYVGQPMIKYKIEDVYGSGTELTVWPTEYKKAKKFMIEGRPIRAHCQVNEFNGVKTLILKSIKNVYGM
jgi:thiol-disulfide isomerase/thioredoxin